MRIKTQFLVSIITFSIILIIIGSSVAITQRQLTDLNNREASANGIQTGASDLSYISNSYFLLQDNSSISLWQAKFSSLSDEIGALNSTNLQEQALVNAVSSDLQVLNAVFAGVTSFLANAPRNVSVRVLPSFQNQWNRLTVQIQSLAFDSQQLSHLVRDQTNQAILTNTVLTVSLFCAFGVFFITIYLMTYRGTVRSISKLKNGIGIIGSGNLNYTLEADKENEIGDISKSVNQMAANLKTVTASKIELEKSQEALSKSEQRWITTLSSIGDSVIATDINGNITFMNDIAVDLTGWSLNEASKRPLQEVFHIVNEDTRLEVENPVAKVLRNGAVIGLANHSLLIRKDGKEIPIDDSGSPIKDQDGQVTGVVHVFHDITERKKAEELLRLSEEKANALIKHAPSGIYEIDFRIPKFKIVNDAMCQIIGYTREELLAINPFNLLDEESKIRFKERITKLLSGQKVDETVEYKIIPKDRREMFAVLNVMLSYNDGKPEGAVVIAHDITERKKAERELADHAKNLEILVEERTKALRDSERLAAIGATAGMVGHDIRNPLQAITSDVFLIKSDLDAVAEGEEKENMKESLDGIQKNIDYVNKIVQDLQDYARPLRSAPKEVNLQKLCEEALLKNSIPKNINSTCKVDEEAKLVLGDPELLRRVLTNLVINAVQAMPEGGKLSIRAYKKEDDVLIDVEDTGVGIPEDVKPKLFTPLFTTKSKGQGFGLAVVKRVTESMNGTITFESQQRKGTTFTVRLPPPKR